MLAQPVGIFHGYDPHGKWEAEKSHPNMGMQGKPEISSFS
jgi:hypothetical protein